jgi:phosphocarrier protein HPr
VSAEAPSAGRISGLDGLRAYAVLLTFLVHFSGPFAARYAHSANGPWHYASVTDAWSQFLAWVSLSFYGVHLFFIISGYIITRRILAAREDFHYSTFLGGRVWRIYPAFLFALVFSIAAARIQDPAFVIEWQRVLVNLLFLNGAGPLLSQSYNAVTWSLFYEWCFYLLIPLVVVLGWRMKGVPGAVVVAFAIAIVATALLDGRYWHYVYFFFAGTMGAVWQREISAALARIPDILVLAAFLAVTSSLGTLVPMPMLDAPNQRWVTSWRFDLFDVAFGLTGLALLDLPRAHLLFALPRARGGDRPVFQHRAGRPRARARQRDAAPGHGFHPLFRRVGRHRLGVVPLAGASLPRGETPPESPAPKTQSGPECGVREREKPYRVQKRTITVVNKLGLHARASAKLTQSASGFQSGVWITRNGRRVNAKSIMGVMMLAASMGSTVELETDGPDEEAAANAIEKLFANKFDEGE